MDNIRELVEAVVKRGAKKILVQLPEGLIVRSQEIQAAFSEKGIETYVSLEPCYGACDLRDSEADRLGCDLLVNVGHSDFGVDERVPTVYVHWKSDADVATPLRKNIDVLKDYKRIGLVSSVNFVHTFDEAIRVLKENGHEAVVGEGSLLPGQVLGCNVSAALVTEKDVDAFLFIGTGQFHPLGVGLRIEKPFFVLDLEKQSITRPDYDAFERQRHAAIGRALDAQRFGILVSTKPGQHFVDPFVIQKKLRERGRDAYVFTMDRITPDKLLGLKLDAYINTACPRIVVENRTGFTKPLLNPDELHELLRRM